MVKITSKKLLGTQQVYDLGLAKDHNFLLSNGLVASNCFNKSHSTAYAYVTYQTAYLKANFPAEYMTALLSASSDSQEKIEKYRENCHKLHIVVESPDINRAQKEFTVVGDHIIFGLSALKNLGEGAIDNILQAREAAGGKFKSLGDFCARVDLRVVNRRAFDTLIYCGAFDRLQSNRKQLINDLDVVISWAQNRAKEKETGQTSLFDIVSPEEASNSDDLGINAPSARPVPDYSTPEKLKLEKEYLGFYLTDHPLKAIHESAYLLSPITFDNLQFHKGRKKVCLVALLTSVKKHISKKGAPMAFLQLEDVNSSTLDAVVFPQAYEKLYELLQPDVTVIIWGKIEEKDDKIQIIVDHAELIENIKMLMIEMEAQAALEQSNQNKLKSLLKEQSGDKSKANVPVFVIINSPEERLFIRLGQDFWVQNENETMTFLLSTGFDAQIQSLVQTF